MSLVMSFSQESFVLTFVQKSASSDCFTDLLLHRPLGLSKLLHYLNVSPLGILTQIPFRDADLDRY